MVSTHGDTILQKYSDFRKVATWSSLVVILFKSVFYLNLSHALLHDASVLIACSHINDAPRSTHLHHTQQKRSAFASKLDRITYTYYLRYEQTNSAFSTYSHRFLSPPYSRIISVYWPSKLLKGLWAARPRFYDRHESSHQVS